MRCGRSDQRASNASGLHSAREAVTGKIKDRAKKKALHGSRSIVACRTLVVFFFFLFLHTCSAAAAVSFFDDADSADVV